jgi:hypothetical protein
MAGQCACSQTLTLLHCTFPREEVAHWQAEVASLQSTVEQANARAEAAELQAKEDMAAADSLARFLTGVMAQLGVSEDGRAAGGKAGVSHSISFSVTSCISFSVPCTGTERIEPEDFNLCFTCDGLEEYLMSVFVWISRRPLEMQAGGMACHHSDDYVRSSFR